jgi:general stress protein 26
MNEPVAELDQRFSGPAAAPVSWDETRQVLEQAELSWIVTVRADSRPHLTPLVAVWSGEALYFTTGADEQKAVNLRGNPHVILMTGRSDWDAGLDVVVEGDAVPVTDDALLTSLAAAWTTKWDGRWQYQARDGAFHHEGGGTALVFAVKPGKALAFAKGSFGQTRYTFAK